MTWSGVRALRTISVLVTAGIVLGACTTINEQGAFWSVSDLVSERTKKNIVWHRDARSRAEARAAVKRLLSRPLKIDDAIQIAFLKNPAIQASLAKIGIAEADVAQAGRLKNPVISLSRIAGGGVLEIERQFLVSLLSLFTIGARSEIARDEAERARYEAALDIVKVADGIRRAWIEAVASRERAKRMKTILISAKAAEDLAIRMAKSGSITPIEQIKVKLYHAEMVAQSARFRMATGMAREKLTRQMGLWGRDTGFRLPSKLAALPRRVRSLKNLERTALMKRLDIQAARKEVELLRKTIGLTKFTGVLNLLEISGFDISENEKEAGEEGEEDVTTKKRLRGVEFEFAIPIFDIGDAKVSRAKWTYMAAVEKLKSLAITARSEVREAYMGYRGSYDLARHYQSNVEPLNKHITEQELLRYNGMLISVFELLSTTRTQAQAAITSLDARRDFWLAVAKRDFSVMAGSGASSGGGSDMVMAAGGSDEEH